MGRHLRPKDQTPSTQLLRSIDYERIPKGFPIADIACGYGRNGAHFAIRGYEVCFVDIDQHALDFIKLGKDVSVEGDFIRTQYSVLQEDLKKNWPFEKGSLAGAICVHFYRPGLIERIVNSLLEGGFLYFETIDNRGGNNLELPRVDEELSKLLQDNFDKVYAKIRNTVYFGLRSHSSR